MWLLIAEGKTCLKKRHKGGIFFLPPPSVAKQFGKGLPWAQRARRNLFLPVHTVWGSNIIVAEWSESNKREKAISLI